MIIPQYLEPIADKESLEDCTFSLAVGSSKEFEVYYVGVEQKIDDALYITPDYEGGKEEFPISKVLIKEKGKDTMHVVYDGRIHGYNNMFCDEHEAIEYPLHQLTLEESDLFSITVTLGYGIDYDDEKEEYEVDNDDMLEVMNRKEKISWQQVKEEGYDWLTIQMTNEKGQSIFVDEELA